MNTYYNSEEVKNMHGTLKPVYVKTDRAVMSDPELSQRAKDLYYLLCSMVKRGSDSLVAYVINLAERQHKSVRTIQYALKELHERGVIIRKFRIRSNYPRRNFPSEFIIVGGNAPCYRENSMTIPEKKKSYGKIKTKSEK